MTHIKRIYTLADPITRQIFYVGKTTESLEKRLKAHISVAIRKRDCELHEKLIDIIETDQYPLIELVEEYLERRDGKLSTELYWIHQFKQWGFELLNRANHKRFINKYGYPVFSKNKFNHQKIEQYEHA